MSAIRARMTKLKAAAYDHPYHERIMKSPRTSRMALQLAYIERMHSDGSCLECAGGHKDAIDDGRVTRLSLTKNCLAVIAFALVAVVDFHRAIDYTHSSALLSRAEWH